MVGVNEQIKNFLSKSMKAWRGDFIYYNHSLGAVDINRRIFQRNSLLSLLFVFVLCYLPLTVILHNLESAYNFSSNKEKINHLFHG